MGSHAEASRQESIEMRIILLLTVFATLGLCQRQSPPRTPLTEPPQGQRCAGRNFNGRRCCTPESPCGYGEGDCDGPLSSTQRISRSNTAGSPTVTQRAMLRTSVSFSRNIVFDWVHQINTTIINK